MKTISRNGKRVGAALVVGGGVGGMQAALDFAAAGIKVYLADSGPCIGGVMAQLDKTFPTNDCAMCTLAPRLVEISRHKDINLITLADIEEVAGQAGDFTVRLKKRPRYVAEDKCNGCGLCALACPLGKLKPSDDPKRPQPLKDEYNRGLSYRPAIYIPFPQAIPNLALVDSANCLYFKTGKCQLCKKACQADAIDFSQKEETLILNVGAIVLTPGYELFDARLKPDYGYGAFKNVISSLEFERILSASGPYGGKVARPSDRATPKRIAFIQCVGSRDCERDYCSAVCCMYATKEALLAKEHAGKDLRCDIYFMDLRAYGKGFEEYYKRAEAQGVRYIRYRPAKVEEAPGTDNLRIAYLEEDGSFADSEYDLVVLSAGLMPSKSGPQLAEKFGLTLDMRGFCANSAFAPLDAPREGIFTAGAFTGPKDIPESVMQASGAVARALEFISGAKGTCLAKEEFPPETDVAGVEPRVGVFVCHCGTNIASVVDVAEVVECALGLPDVFHAEKVLYACSSDSQEKIKKTIREKALNRVVVAACTPRTHEPLFRKTVREAGLNPYLFEMANIRDQCSWVHMHQPQRATWKAKRLVKMSAAKARRLEPLYRKNVPILKDVLVIGGGLSGMTAALSLADQGFQVHLVEREAELGGNLRRLRYLLGAAADPGRHLAGLIGRVRAHANLKLYTGAKLVSVEGCIGNFKSRVAHNGRDVEICHGAVIVATGAAEHKPAEYLYGKNPNVLTQLELEEKLALSAKGGPPPIQHGGHSAGLFGGQPSVFSPQPSTVVMIQCVGSRDKDRPYCSRVCCGMAVKNALKIKEVSPSTKVYILYRDVRTYGFSEAFYTEARRQGVVFARYEEEKKPAVAESGGKLEVRFHDPVAQAEVVVKADLVALSAATAPLPENKELAQLLKVPLDSNGFFLEAHMKLRPVDFATDGVFLAGLAHYPKTAEESVAQALAAAARTAVVLARDTMEIEPTISRVLDENCDGCAYCVDPCTYKAITLLEYMYNGAIKKTVEVNESLCKGCGVCQATCPKNAIMVSHFKPDQLKAMLWAALNIPAEAATEKSS